jgi:hypothetical protein
VQLIISQDIVATRSGFVVKYDNCFKVYLLLNLMLKKFWKSVNIWLRYRQKYRSRSLFWLTAYIAKFNFCRSFKCSQVIVQVQTQILWRCLHVLIRALCFIMLATSRLLTATNELVILRKFRDFWCTGLRFRPLGGAAQPASSVHLVQKYFPSMADPCMRKPTPRANCWVWGHPSCMRSPISKCYGHERTTNTHGVSITSSIVAHRSARGSSKRDNLHWFIPFQVVTVFRLRLTTNLRLGGAEPL